MAQVIESLLIGVGLQTDKKSFNNAEGSLDGLKSKALQVGAVLAGAFGVDALTFGFAEKTDELGKFSERWEVAANDVAAYDRALGLAGGKTGEFLGTVRNLSKALTLAPFERAALLGELSKFGIGDQVNEVLDAGSALDAFLVAADQLQTLQGKQKEKFIEALGFSEAEVRLLSSGRAEILKVVSAQQKMAPVTKKMTDTAALFNDEYQDLITNVSGFSSQAAEPLTASIAEIIAGMNDWIDINRNVANSILEIGVGTVADNIGMISTAIGLLGGASALGALTSVAAKIGIISGGAVTAAASVASILTGLGLVAAASVVVSEAGEGGVLSASSIFGGGDVTKFLDTPISEHIDSFLKDRTLDAPVTQSTSYGTQRPISSSPIDQSLSDAVVSSSPSLKRFSGDTAANQESELNYSNAKAQPSQKSNQIIKVEVMLDGAPVKAITKQVILEAGEQVIQDFATSDGG